MDSSRESLQCRVRAQALLPILLLTACAFRPAGPASPGVTQEQLRELLAEAEELVQSAEAVSSPDAMIPLLDRARTKLYQTMSLYREFDEAAALADGGKVGSLQRDHVERLLREARMDVCREDPGYACIIESAHAAARATAADRMDLAYRTIALAQARVGDIEGALATARHIPGIEAATHDRDGGEFALYPRFDDPREVIVHMQARFGDIEGARVTAGRFGVDIPWQEVVNSAFRRGDAPGVAGAAERGDTGAERRGDETGLLAEDVAAARVRAGDIDGAFAAIDSDPMLSLEDPPRNRAYRVLTPRVAIAAARLEAGDSAAAGEILDIIQGAIVRHRGRLASGVDHTHFYETAGMMADVAALLHRIGEAEQARGMLAEAIGEAAKIEEWDNHFFDPAAPEDPGTFGVYGSGTNDATTASNPLSEHYAYVRGVAFQRVMCTAMTAGLPVSRETLRRAVVPVGRTRGRRYHVRTWTMAAVAMALIDHPCPDSAEAPWE